MVCLHISISVCKYVITCVYACMCGHTHTHVEERPETDIKNLLCSLSILFTEAGSLN